MMKTLIKNLKKNDMFEFNGCHYKVIQKFADWKKDGEPYMVASDGFNGREQFYNEELEVTKL